MTTGQQDAPLWTLAKVKQWLHDYGASGDTSLAIILASDIVYDYEQLRATLTAQLAELEAQLAQAEQLKRIADSLDVIIAEWSKPRFVVNTQDRK